MDVLRTHARELRNGATDAERHLWRYLRRRQLAGFKFRRQFPVAGYIADFACVPARLIVELDGGLHADAVAYDQRRAERLAANGFRVLRFWNDDVLRGTDAVLEQILRQLPQR